MGNSFRQFYETSQDLIETIVPILSRRACSNEFCMWITSEPLGVDRAMAALKAAVPDLDEYMNQGQKRSSITSSGHPMRKVLPMR